MSLVLLLSISFVFYQNKIQVIDNKQVVKINKKSSVAILNEKRAILPTKNISVSIKHSLKSIENIAVLEPKDTVQINVNKDITALPILVMSNTFPKDSINVKAVLVKSKAKTPQPRFPMKHQNDFQSKIYEENKADVAKQVFILQGDDNLESYLNHIKNN